MASFNRVILTGNLGKDPEVRFTSDGKAVANFSLAVSEKYKDKETTYWARCTVWGKGAEVLGQYAKKGHPLLVEGRLVLREWEKDGVKREQTEIMVENFQFLAKKDSGSSSKADTGDLPF